MRIEKYLNVSASDVKAKKFNIFIGMSLGNKFFLDEGNMKEFLLWAVENSKSNVAVLIPDKIHAINIEVRGRYSKNRAFNIAVRKGEEAKEFVEGLIKSLPINDFQKSCIVVFRWQDIENNREYQVRKKVLYEAFEENSIFHSRIIDIVKENTQKLNLNNEDYEKLSSYPLDELPVLITGPEYNGIRYDLIPYPGISKIDHLVIDLQEGISFPNITERLNITNKVALVEAYIKSI